MACPSFGWEAMAEKGRKMFEGFHGSPVKTKLLQGDAIALICLKKLDQGGAFGPELMNCESSDVAHEEAKVLRWFGSADVSEVICVVTGRDLTMKIELC